MLGIFFLFPWLGAAGNSAYETADHIVSSTNLIHMVAR